MEWGWEKWTFMWEWLHKMSIGIQYGSWSQVLNAYKRTLHSQSKETWTNTDLSIQMSFAVLLSASQTQLEDWLCCRICHGKTMQRHLVNELILVLRLPSNQDSKTIAKACSICGISKGTPITFKTTPLRCYTQSPPKGQKKTTPTSVSRTVIFFDLVH